MEVSGQLTGVGTLLPLCRTEGPNQVIRVGDKCLSPLSHARSDHSSKLTLLIFFPKGLAEARSYCVPMYLMEECSSSLL